MAVTTALETQTAPGRRVPLVADAPLIDPKLDRFGFAEFANALALLIDNEHTATPLTIAVSAPWGGGKSSLGGMVQTLLEQRVHNRNDDDPRLVCWFNAWEHDGAPHLGAALAAAVARAVDRHRSWWRRALLPLPSAMLRPGERSRQTLVIAAFSAVVAGLMLAIGPMGRLGDLVIGEPDRQAAGAGVLGALFLGLLLARRVFTTAKEAARFVDDPRSAAARGSMSDVKAQFGRLIRHATHNGRLVIIIDDLERCDSARALEVCQVASLLLAHPGVVTIVLADMEPIARAAGERYAESMAGGNGVIDPEEVGRRYLAKIVQLEIALPPPVPDDMRKVIHEYGPGLRTAETTPRQRRKLRRSSLFMHAQLMRRLPAVLRTPSRVWQRIQRVVERTGWWPFVAVVLSAAIYGVINPTWANSNEDDPISTVGGILLFVFIFTGLWARRLRRKRRAQRANLAAHIEKLKNEEGLSQEEVQARVAENVAGETESGLVSDLVSSSFLDSDEFRAVENYISTNPPALPREAKRSFNHAQLLTEIARARHMFGGRPELTPAHLAKWLVLREQWPALGRRIALEPECLGQLQPTDVGAEAWELLSEEPPLAGVIERLVYFQPANGRQPF